MDTPNNSINAIVTITPSTIKELNQPVTDLLSSLLASKHVKTTQKTYASGIKHFSSYLLGSGIQKGKTIAVTDSQVKLAIAQFLHLDKPQALSYLAEYQVSLIEAGYTPNAINVRIAAIKALVNHAFKFGVVSYRLDDIKALPPDTYRDTSGIKVTEVKALVDTIDTSTPNGKRDYSILRLLWDLGLRRAEVSNLDVIDYNPALKTLKIKGKGRLSKETIQLPEITSSALNQWLSARPQIDGCNALFIALDWRSYGNRTSTKHIYQLVREAGAEVTSKPLSPHKIRHSAITALLDQSNGNVRMAQKFSRHKSLEILTKYDDNRQALQSEAVSILAGLV